MPSPIQQPRLRFDEPVSFDPKALTVARSPFTEAQETSALGAIQAAPAAAGKARRLLELIAAAGTDGLADFEIADVTKWPRQTICSVRNSVRMFLVPASRRAISPYGVPSTCWRRATRKEVAINRWREWQRIRAARGGR